MRTLILLVVLVTPWLPALASAQADFYAGAGTFEVESVEERIEVDLVEDALIEEDRVLSARLLDESDRDPLAVEFSTELRLLDQRLRGQERSDGSTATGIGLIIPGGLATVTGVVLLLTGALSSGLRAGVRGVASALGSTSPGGRDDSSLLEAGGLTLGAGVIALVVGLVLALSGRDSSGAFDRRDEMRFRLRTWASAGMSTSDGVSFVVGTSL